MEPTTLAISKDTILNLDQVADQMGTTPDALASKAIRRFLREEAEHKVRLEEQYFRAQHASLLEQYAGRFVAMHDGQVIDTDDDELALYLRVRGRFPAVGILIKRVVADAETVWVMRSPRLEYD
jgi:predicted transcriptional regulator